MKHIQYTPSQQEALHLVKQFLSNAEASVFMLNGAAGTGKTTLVKTIIEQLDLEGRPCKLMAPTGRAAHILSQRTGKPACTIHRSIYTLNKLEIKKETGQNYAQFKLCINKDSIHTIYIVDEASMVSDIQQENETFRFGSGRLLTDLFTFTAQRKVILVGDYAQLPPVGMSLSPALNREYLETNFGTKVWEYNLREVMRQNQESMILTNAMKIRKSIDEENFVELQLEKGDDVVMTDNLLKPYFEYAPNKPNHHAIIVAFSNRQTQEYNKQVRTHYYGANTNWLNRDELLIITHNNYAYGVELFNGNIVKVAEAVADDAIECREVKVKRGKDKTEIVKLMFGNADICFKNGYNVCKLSIKILVNSLTASENSLTDELLPQALIVDFKNRLPQHLKNISPTDSNYQKYLDLLKTDPYYNALRCKYGYAITCHKAQGGEWSEVFVDMGRYGSRTNKDFFRWAYTALTRSSHKLWLYRAPDFNYISQLTVEEIQLSKCPKISIFAEGNDFRMARFERLEAYCKYAHLQVTQDLSYNYEHRISFKNDNNEDATFTLWYNAKGYSGKERMIHTSSEEFAACCRNLLYKSFPPKNVPFTATDRPFAEKLVDFIKSQLQDLDIQLLNITQEQYQDVFHLQTDGIAKICMFYSKNGKYTCMQLQSSLGKGDLKLQKLRERFR